MASEVDIYNLALGHVGNSYAIADSSEDSNEANLCKRFYATARDRVLRSYEWSFCTEFVDLGLIEEDPTDEWGYSYRYPTNAIAVRRILSGTRLDRQGTVVDYRVVRRSAGGSLIYTDKDDAIAEITNAETDAGRFPIGVVLAISYQLGLLIIRALGKGDPWKIRTDLTVEYRQALSEAIADNENEQQPDMKTRSNFTRAREQ